MYKKTVTYEDFDGVTRTEDLYFNLSKVEVTEMELTCPGGYANMLDTVVKSRDNSLIYKIFSEIVDKAYGEKSADGKYFRKTPEILADFKSSAAYDQFMFSLLGDGGKSAAEFVNGIMPQSKYTNEELLKKTKVLLYSKEAAALESD